jgi:arginine:ornithine antiporter/lysine permease
VTAVETKAPTEVRRFPLSVIIYTPGTVLFVMSRREQNRRAFSRAELVICVIAVAGAITGIAALATGAITI